MPRPGRFRIAAVSVVPYPASQGWIPGCSSFWSTSGAETLLNIRCLPPGRKGLAAGRQVRAWSSFCSPDRCGHRLPDGLCPDRQSQTALLVEMAQVQVWLGVVVSLAWVMSLSER